MNAKASVALDPIAGAQLCGSATLWPTTSFLKK
jgi:hypothetical protein